MASIRSIHNHLFTRLSQLFGGWFLPTLARFVFAAVLLFYFWNSAKTKVSDGYFGFLTPSDSAYMQIFPKTSKVLGYDSSALNGFHWLIAVTGTITEFVLPLLIIIGLFTRIAALGMAGFVMMQSYVDITGHDLGDKDIGAWFDHSSDSLLMDQRLLWMVLFAILVTKGAGPISLDRMFRNS